MSSPLTPTLSSSPKSYTSDRDTSPTRLRNASGSENEHHRHSPTLSRNFNPLDPEVRERQRTLDVDMALHLQRARRESNATTSPTTTPLASRDRDHEDLLSHPHPHPHSSSHSHTNLVGPDRSPEIFPAFSEQEEQELDTARGAGPPSVIDEVREEVYQRTPTPEDLRMPHLSQGHEPDLLVSLDQARRSDPGLPMYQPPLVQAQSTFHFKHMEDFAHKEKEKFGLTSSTHTPTLRQRTQMPAPSEAADEANVTSASSGPGDFKIPLPRPARQRKLSQSNSAPRRLGGKMALFEGGAAGAPPPSFTRAPHLFQGGSGGAILSAVSSYENIPDTLGIPIPPPAGASTGVAGGSASGTGAGIASGADAGTGLGLGHDRPYRFSFYSNLLSATIHARSLSELPAEGQTFEELFSAAGGSGLASGVGSDAGGGRGSGSTSPAFINGVNGNGSSKTALNDRGPGGAGDPELHTWWLDVLSPTDEEMKMLSQVFNIHPLTTEDIQMEEAREKIELFRTYYLVCFRSFDQDPYSPTYLEPLNMYIIVFREGILSFHFRPTPHPQNVRRRIKQLKDYISVTSDWISYALIDDITDAFGPLIQSIEYEVDSIDELVLILKEAEQSDMLRRIGTCRKKVMGLLRLMGNKADVVKGLAKRCNENWKVAPTSDIGLYLSDIQDHLITMTQNLNHYEKILSRSHSNYLAQISIEMTDANNQINDVLSKLTALGTVLIPMNLVTGLWGMNVHVPGQDIATGYAWFGSIIAALAAFAIVGGYTTYRFMVGK